MSHSHRIFIVGSIYHLFDRGVEKRTIFQCDDDYHHFLLALSYYQQAQIKPRLSLSNYKITDRSEELLFEIISYCLMPNHFHLIVKQLAEGGISRGIANLLNSYSRYFNRKYDRIGPLFQGRFKSVNVLTDEQFMQLTRYIFLNPYVAGLSLSPFEYHWSSISECLNGNLTGICNISDLKDYFPDGETLKKFITDYADYAKTLKQIEHDVLD